ncbi:MAG: hypothetical protein EA381_03795 [Planctomycetaceae bacterium]|nr:MAG: hypothetical protein EA381_03795 [Planctomycetaceae bacterium]
MFLSACVMSMSAHAAELPNPYPREYVLEELVKSWDFESPADGSADRGWRALNDCTLEVTDGRLRIRASGGDPYLLAPVVADGSDFAVRLRVRAETDGKGQLFWSTRRHPGSSESRQVRFDLKHDGQWHEYLVPLTLSPEDGGLTALRFDPGTAPGEIEIDRISVHRGRHHPLEILGLVRDGGQTSVRILNHDERPVEARVDGKPFRLEPSQSTDVPLPQRPPAALESREVVVEAAGLPALTRRFWQYDPAVPTETHRRDLGDLRLELARDGQVLRLYRHGVVVAAIAPLAHVGTEPIELGVVDPSSWPIELRGEGIRIRLAGSEPGELQIDIDSEREIEGPVVRVFGQLEQGLMAGVEYLGRGEQSSSRLDIETEEHLRVEPPPMHLTMPLMALVTEGSAVAMLWQDSELQPTFAVPDFIDHGPGHRLGLKGKRVSASLRIGEGWSDGGRLEDAIEWAVRRRGLPPLPPLPRPFDEQQALSLAAYRGAILDETHGGWFHAVVPGLRTMPARGAPFADCASAIFRLTGEVPELERLQYGGAHISNPTSYFVSGRAAEWLRIVDRQAADLRGAQQPDGSYRYGGEFRRGHFEDTASGVCGRPAFLLLEHAHLTGNADSQAAGLLALKYAERFRTPRGAQTWEVPLHTPDILASAHLVWAHVRAFELTGEREHLEHARRWAVAGLPFVYQWSNRPVMNYATTAVYGATQWQAPNWIGLPVQWCGTVYAYALLLLAEHEPSFDWRGVAEGILICAEQMQYPDGPSVGCLPDAFSLPTQTRIPADIHPGVLVDLRLKLSGHQDGLAMATDGKHRVVSPFPVTLREGRALLRGPAGIDFQIVVDGRRVIDVRSTGEDEISLEP